MCFLTWETLFFPKCNAKDKRKAIIPVNNIYQFSKGIITCTDGDFRTF